MEEGSPLSCALADQGIKIRIRKVVGTRKKGDVAAGDGNADGRGR
jgi:hypothetical protein